MATEGSTMREDVVAEHLRQAAEAVERIRDNHWRDWTAVARGLSDLRMLALRSSHSNEPMGKRYNTAFGGLMDEQKWPRKLDKATIAHCFWIADHLVEVERWRETQAANVRDRMNHPSVVKRNYERAMRVQESKAEGGEPAKSPYAQIKDALIASQEETHHWKRQAEEGGSMFDLRRDTPEMIARILVESVTPSRAENIAKAIRAELKRQKQAHAG